MTPAQRLNCTVCGSLWARCDHGWEGLDTRSLTDLIADSLASTPLPEAEKAHLRAINADLERAR